MMRALRLPAPLVALLAALLLAACGSVGRDYEAPVVDVPEAWRGAAEEAFAERSAELALWWQRLEDPVLNGLIERAALQSLDRREALARVREARALRGETAADRFPTVDARAAYEHRVESESTPIGEFVPDSDIVSVGFDATWEIDLWGRVRRSVEAADADLEASIEDARDVAVTVAAEIAVAYVDLRSFQRRIAIALTNVELQGETLSLARARFEAGLVGERDVAQAATNLETTRSFVPALTIGLRAAENRLAVLVGLTPGALAVELAEVRPIPVPPLEVAVGVPADLLRRRADVRRAERALAAETARVGVAEGDLYPRLTLDGTMGLASNGLTDPDLFNHESSVFGIGPSLRWNLFDAGRLRNRVEAQDARAEQAFVRWERTVLTALEETENAMTAFVQEQLRRGSLVEAVAQARRAVELSQTQYREGLSDFQTVVNSERALAELEDEVARNDAAIATSLVRLYKALGGGWEHGDGTV
jgi:NodT family efflux transporter outer membrane factor (OMF) lipoprotein